MILSSCVVNLVGKGWLIARHGVATPPTSEPNMHSTPLRAASIAAIVLALASPVASADAGKTRIGGRMFFDLSSLEERYNDTGKTDASSFALDVKRFYVDIAHALDSTWKLQLTTDFTWSSSDGETQLFVKKAYLEGKFSKAAVLRVGSADMPWISFVDKAQGFRYIEKSVVDRTKFGNSADWGVHLGGKLGAGQQFDYAVAMVNGAGYKDPGRSKSVDFEGRIAYLPSSRIMLALGAYSGRRGKDLESSPAIHTTQRVSAMAAYVSDRTRAGIEYFKSDNWNEVNKPTGDHAKGWSVWASQALGEQFTLTARVDRTTPSHVRDPRSAERYAHLGLEYSLRDNLDLALVWKNGATDSSASRDGIAYTRHRRGNEVGIWGQVSF
ncbi:carbohydrate porin [Dokdonella sp.]|uniref:carbohydrate porin n=1 Tax=Dokdonella sp. TaxID=2291710 RepID=UPI0025C30442|nr:carbohydrate porin [Dokdonella sp.]MBX3690080.1 carbohydrate porin [Dokdonella sp.]